jgi:hypothetical protein
MPKEHETPFDHPTPSRRNWVCSAWATVLAFFTGGANAATNLSINQVSGPASLAGTVVVVLPNGKLASAIVGSGLSLAITTPITLSAPASAGPSFADVETPSGTVDANNLIFTLVKAPVPPQSLAFFRNGLKQRAGGNDFVLSGSTVTFNPASAPQVGDLLEANYRF